MWWRWAGAALDGPGRIEMNELSLPLRRELIGSLRNGSVPVRGLEHLATGLERFDVAIAEELDQVALGGGTFKAIRGEYGSGKTFFSRWVQHVAREKNFVTAEVQVSEGEAPLHRLDVLYRRILEQLQTSQWSSGAFRKLIDKWFFSLEEDAIRSGRAPENDPRRLTREVGKMLEQRLADVSAVQPMFATCLRAIHEARLVGDPATADGVLGWLMGQPNVGAVPKRAAGIKGELGPTEAPGFLRGALEIIEQTGRSGLVVILDEVETVQRLRGDLRRRAYESLRQLIDDMSANRYPKLYLVITGTTAFFESPRGVKELEALSQRLHVDFSGPPEFDSSRAVQIRLTGFGRERLLEVGRKVRSVYPASDSTRLLDVVDDALISRLADAVIGRLGDNVGIAPRLFLKKLVQLLDKVDEHPTFDPRLHFEDDLSPSEMSVEERAAAGVARTVDDIELDGVG